ncbi:MAG TPA: beta-N-acetylhexosaminidase [Polyangia bacterium]|nr:beta-N-acetylhexosaminidase [Polyangia bacterium]
MSARAGELLIIGFEGPRPSKELLGRIAEGRIGGVVLFARNLGTLDEIAALTRELQSAVPPGAPPLVVSLDQEGGRVQRIKAPLAVWPPMAQVGARGDEALSQAVGRALGAELHAIGFNVDYAPVLDVHTNPQNPIIGDRAFATEPAEAARQALAFWRGLEAAGVRGCGKHFPGHGDTATDSHLELPRVDAAEPRLRAVELAPFAAAVRAGVPMIMTAHVVYPAIDARPATLSRRWLDDILRRELGFGGVILSDDLDMKAVAAHFPVEETVIDSLLAGCDAFLACRDVAVQQKSEAALDHAAAVDPAVRARLDESAARLRAFRQTLATPPPADAWRKLPLADHLALADRIRA